MSAVPWLLIALAPAPVAITTDEAAATVTRVAFHLPVAFTEASSLYSCTITDRKAPGALIKERRETQTPPSCELKYKGEPASRRLSYTVHRFWRVFALVRARTGNI